jgi:signal transduction histidine kinase
VQAGQRLQDVLPWIHTHDDLARWEDSFSSEGRQFLFSCVLLEGEERRVMLAQDVTERAAISEQLQRSQKLESVSRLAGGVAHDFNNALGSILPCVEMLRRKVSDEKSLGYVDSIEKAALRSADVVRQLLTFSRAGGYAPKRLDLNQTIEGALKLLRPSAKGVVIQWNPAQDLPKVMGDETQLHQLIFNLTINSLDALEGRGTITVETWHTPENQQVHFSVRDTGPGVPQHLRDVIFDPFFTTKLTGQGSGLGLSIAYAVVERHGGKIRLIDGGEGTGAHFVIDLPVYEAPAEETAGPGGRASSRDVVIGG